MLLTNCGRIDKKNLHGVRHDLIIDITILIWFDQLNSSIKIITCDNEVSCVSHIVAIRY